MGHLHKEVHRACSLLRPPLRVGTHEHSINHAVMLTGRVCTFALRQRQVATHDKFKAKSRTEYGVIAKGHVVKHAAFVLRVRAYSSFWACAHEHCLHPQHWTCLSNLSAEINLLESPGGATGRPVTWKMIQHWFLNARKRTRGGLPAPIQYGMQSCSTKSAQELSGKSVGEEQGTGDFEAHEQRKLHDHVIMLISVSF